ncbi:nucleoside hydrolase [Tuwongella immobilis]|uniref:Inosine/uridine-preferring nucleoside hydrolase domain-containing protein n=1 Tax=Tuwongella immobilis TaxID=692036 RepID=A0A6C2YME6_9BACT|nr:nucleoside hydrolase [Tuwongella immobilis]VIP02768.1 inosine-uridine preferring nucleoside hydrolase : Inosine-uridine preferring nucleoside hydrolase OS=Rhodopirellula sallentina SM41 GN=RSSM_02857 PE=4 SV=1: IU_nuc_hydro [Tuwongella immobilis]VTS02393.1 inosine-uridine preferring nucleoside hydrolase : Inosine-uridine preferring nucleoside hydrolase OS=Rhodopirellula sallentina SM41 GN=RSSM_02857 PE=4 SV=1: IU_nuc_hydro [Tuwongella immobilis]
MPQKLVIIADPGIDAAFAIALAMHDPDLDLVGLLPTAGYVSAQQATLNCHILVNHLDPRKWPRVGTALPVQYDVKPDDLHGPGGLGGIEYPCAIPHQQVPSDRLLTELVRIDPHELTIVVMGPCTVLATALDREPDLLRRVERVVVLGGSYREPGNVSPVAEFHFACDPLAAQQVVQSSGQVQVIPLDQMRKLVFSPTDLLELPSPESRTSQFLRSMMPYAIRASSNLYGIEGFHLSAVLGVAAIADPGAIQFREVNMDVETRGLLTRGMSVIDERPGGEAQPNVLMANQIDQSRIKNYIRRILSAAT